MIFFKSKEPLASPKCAECNERTNFYAVLNADREKQELVKTIAYQDCVIKALREERGYLKECLSKSDNTHQQQQLEQ